MSNPLLKIKCAAARVCWEATTSGRFNSRLTTPTQQRTFFARRSLAAQEVQAMGYSLATPRFGMIVEVNLSRTFLHRAYTALQAGKLFEAGVLLRESVRRQLYAECVWKNCLPDGANDRTSCAVLLKAQRKAGIIGDCSYAMTKEIIDLGNRAAHCGHVDAGEIRSCIAIWHTAIDADPCGEPQERVEHCKPGTEGYAVDDCDDDDPADWWKSEGGAT